MNHKPVICWSKRIASILFFTFMVCITANPTNVYAEHNANTVPDIETFIQSVENGEMANLRGVYVPNIMAYPVIQQPEYDSGFISTIPSVVTEFRMAARLGNTGLLAHNTLAGIAFSKINIENQITLIYGDGRMETFIVKEILKYQALPDNIYRDLETGEILDVGELFYKTYGGDRRVTLQTCLEYRNDLNWGRLFIIAKPSAPFTSPNPLPQTEYQTAPQRQISQSSGVGWPLLRGNIR